MLTETLIHHEQQTLNTEFITQFTAYKQYQEKGGILSMRSWVDAKNKGADFRTLRKEFPPQGQDPFSRYIQLGGNINPELFYQINPEVFGIYRGYNFKSPRYPSYVYPALLQKPLLTLEAQGLLEEMEAHDILPPTEISTLYLQIATLDPSLPGVGTPEKIYLELGDIPETHKLLDAARMVSALTQNEHFFSYSQKFTAAMEIRPTVQPWNLTDPLLQIETYLIQGNIDQAKALKDSLPKPPSETN